MSLLLPRGHRHVRALEARGVPVQTAATPGHTQLAVGVVNLMPKAEDYELLLLTALGRALLHAPLRGACRELTPRFIRLDTHHYGSSDADTLASYLSYAQAREFGPLSGLIVTGAPVEELAFDDVRYWPELRTILARAREELPSTLGLCWGGMALAALMGVPKVRFPAKLFGMYPLAPVHAHDAVLAGPCAQSRHAGCSEVTLEREAARGNLRLRARGERVGHSVFESTDGRFVMHLGHPEYDVARLVFEYERDRRLARPDVSAPVGIDLAHPERSASTHGPAFFAHWLASLDPRVVTSGSPAA